DHMIVDEGLAGVLRVDAPKHLYEFVAAGDRVVLHTLYGDGGVLGEKVRHTFRIFGPQVMTVEAGQFPDCPPVEPLRQALLDGLHCYSRGFGAIAAGRKCAPRSGCAGYPACRRKSSPTARRSNRCSTIHRIAHAANRPSSAPAARPESFPGHTAAARSSTNAASSARIPRLAAARAGSARAGAGWSAALAPRRHRTERAFRAREGPRSSACRRAAPCARDRPSPPNWCDTWPG